MLEAQELAVLQQAVVDWFRSHGRDLPWRRTRDPYRILVSEVMLQQTQVERVIPYYERFLERFPTVEELAAAPLATVIELWGGLGYNRRAVYLWRAARAVVQEYGGKFPRERRTLERLPGVGQYTAGAIACFAFGAAEAFWDTNIARVLTRIFVGPEARLSARELDALANRVLAPETPYEWNQGLMELGSAVCLARRPRCQACPVARWCRSVGTSGRSTRRRTERFEGSRRFFRGRILASLRQAGQGGVTLDELARSLSVGTAPLQHGQLWDLVHQLQRDGLVEVREERAGYVVRLPDAHEP